MAKHIQRPNISDMIEKLTIAEAYKNNVPIYKWNRVMLSLILSVLINANQQLILMYWFCIHNQYSCRSKSVIHTNSYYN